jgi:hypothetical protein
MVEGGNMMSLVYGGYVVSLLFGVDVASSAVWFSWDVCSPCLLPSSIQVERPYMYTRPTAASTSKQRLARESRTRTLSLLLFAAFCSAEVA